jgi:hypothetical protein
MQCGFLREDLNRSTINRLVQTSENTDAVITNEKGAIGRKRKLRPINVLKKL